MSSFVVMGSCQAIKLAEALSEAGHKAHYKRLMSTEMFHKNSFSCDQYFSALVDKCSLSNVFYSGSWVDQSIFDENIAHADSIVFNLFHEPFRVLINKNTKHRVATYADQFMNNDAFGTLLRKHYTEFKTNRPYCLRFISMILRARKFFPQKNIYILTRPQGYKVYFPGFFHYLVDGSFHSRQIQKAINELNLTNVHILDVDTFAYNFLKLNNKHIDEVYRYFRVTIDRNAKIERDADHFDCGFVKYIALNLENKFDFDFTKFSDIPYSVPYLDENFIIQLLTSGNAGDWSRSIFYIMLTGKYLDVLLNHAKLCPIDNLVLSNLKKIRKVVSHPGFNDFFISHLCRVTSALTTCDNDKLYHYAEYKRKVVEEIE